MTTVSVRTAARLAGEETQASWDESLNLLNTYVKVNGGLPVQDFPGSQQTTMVQWLRRQRRLHRLGKLDTTRAHTLRSCHPLIAEMFAPIDLLGEAWSAKASELAHFAATHRRLPAQMNPDESHLYGWLSVQRRTAAAGNLSVNRVQVLRSFPSPVGDIFAPTREPWDESFLKVTMFIKVHGRFPLISDAEEKPLLTWIYRQKDLHRSGKLSAARLESLRNAGGQLAEMFSVVEHRDLRWTAHLEEISDYVQRYSAIPQRDSPVLNERRLWRWISSQYTLARRGELSEARVTMLKNATPLISYRFAKLWN